MSLVAARDVHERICESGASDHVRLLPGDRLEPNVGSVRVSRRAHELVARGIAPESGRDMAERVPRQRIGGALPGQKSRPDEDERAHERRDRVAGKAEHERLAAHTERERLSGLDGDAPEDLLHAEVCLDAHERDRARPSTRRPT